MNLRKVGCFFKELRKAKGLTQEQLAEQLHVTGRTVSRWETGRNMPDIDVLIAMADFYTVDIRELIDGERKCDKMDKDIKETVLKVADYNNEEKDHLMKKLHIFSWIGVLAFMVSMVIKSLGLADRGATEKISSFCNGLSFGILIIALLYTSFYIAKFRTFKKNLFEHK